MMQASPGRFFKLPGFVHFDNFRGEASKRALCGIPVRRGEPSAPQTYVPADSAGWIARWRATRSRGAADRESGERVPIVSQRCLMR